MKLLIIAPHLSTGGQPQYLLEYLKKFYKDYSEIKVVEFTNFSSAYVIQKNKIKDLIGEENLICLGEFGSQTWDEDKHKLIDILNDFNPDGVWMNEFPEAYEYKAPTKSVMDYLYREDRPYKIIETTHFNAFNFNNKVYISDEFMFCSDDHMERSINIDIPKSIWKTPMDIKERPDRNSTLESLGLDPSYYHVLNVGLFQDNKNQKYIFELANKMKNDKVMFHFIGNDCFLNSCGITEDEFNLDNYKIWGERYDVDTFMSCMDLFLFPSKKELNPLTIRESLSWNMEVIVNRDEYVSQYTNLPNFQIIDEIDVESFIKSKLKKFLLVCSIYNKEIDQILRTINSVMNQSYTNWELVIGDDFSDDNNSVDILKQYINSINDPRVSFYEIKEKYELYLYQNFFKEKDYDYYFDLDSDDIIDSDLLNIYQKHYIKYPEVNSIFCDFIVTDENSNRERYGLVNTSNDFIEDFDIRLDSSYMSIWEKRSSWNMFGVARSFRRSNFDKFEIGKKCRTATDSMVLFNTLIEGNHLHIPMNLYTYERRKNSDSFTPMSEQELIDYNVNTLIAIDKFKKNSSYNSIDIYSDVYKETSAIIMSGYKNDIGLISDINNNQFEKLKFLYGDKIKLNDTSCENLIITSGDYSHFESDRNISIYKYFNDFEIDENELEKYFIDDKDSFISTLPKNIKFEYFHYFRHFIIQRKKLITPTISISNINTNLSDVNEFKVDDTSGVKFSVIGNEQKSYFIEFINQDTNEVIFSDNISNNMWSSPSPKYYVNWEIRKDGISVYKQDLKNKRVFFSFDSSSLGDTLAWFPYLRKFKEKHGCEIVVSTFKNWLFEGLSEYNDFEFITPGDRYLNINKVYNIGWFYNEDQVDFSKHPNNFRNIPLQKTMTDILGLEYDEIKPDINQYYNDTSPIDKKYVCISIHSTAQAKYWNNPNGWQDVVNHIKNLGYEVVLLSREENGYMGNIHPEGVIHISSDLRSTDKSNNYTNYLKHCEFYIGTGSGLSWLSWALNTPTILISGFSEKYTEFNGYDVIRVINEESDTCRGCFNSHKLDGSDWNWCPLYKGTDRQFECSKSITSKKVIDSVDSMISMKGFDWGIENDYGKPMMKDEIFVEHCYEQFFEVESGDIVLDVGASVGPFTRSILHKNPSKVYCFEPSKTELETLKKNTENDNVIVINKGIGSITGNIEVGRQILLDRDKVMDTITFNDFINDYDVDKIDFLKTDCEGGEYDIFKEENIHWIKDNVKKISGEWHLKDDVNRFKHFRDVILPHFENFEVYSIDGVNIKWDLYNDHFTEYYNEIFVYIDNREEII